MLEFREKFKSLFLRTFDIREGEYLRAILMQVYIFLIISVLLIIKPVVNALFLAEYGSAGLPVAYILVAIVAGIVSTIYSKILSDVSLIRLIIATLLVSMVCLTFFGVMLHSGLYKDILLYVFYIWISIFALLTTSQFWLLATVAFNAREAKRVFGFVGAGAIAGGIFGGYLATYLVPILSSESLPFVCVLLLLPCLPIAHKTWKRRKKLSGNRFQEQKATDESIDNPLTQILLSKHLLYISSILGLSVIVAKLVDFQFSDIAATLITDANELAIFFGFWFSTFNVISLAIQLFLTRRTISFFGVSKSLLFLPISIFVTTLFLITAPELLMAAVFLKMSEGSLKQSVNKSALELIILPLPVIIKKQTKTFIDVFVDSFATGLSGLILIFLIKGMNFSTQAINIMILVLILFWIYFIKKINKEYLNSFHQRLIKNKKLLQKNSERKKLNKLLAKGFEVILEDGEEEEINLALKRLRDKDSTEFPEKIQKLLDHPSATIRAEALENLYFYPKLNISERVEKMVDDTTPKVKIAALEYLIQRSKKNKVKLLNDFWKNGDTPTRGAILVSLAKEMRDNEKRKLKYNVKNKIRLEYESLGEIKSKEAQNSMIKSIIKAVGHADIPELFPILQKYLKSEIPSIKKTAILAVGDTLDVSFVDDLLEILREKEYEEKAIKALVNYGNSMVGFLKRRLEKNELEDEVLRDLPLILKEIGTQKSVNLLFQLFRDEDYITRQKALTALAKLRKKYPHLRFSQLRMMKRIKKEVKVFEETLSILYVQNNIQKTEKENEKIDIQTTRSILINLMESRLKTSLENIFQLLSLKYRSDYMITIHQGLKSKNPDFRTDSLEFLDNLLKSKMKFLIPILELAMIDVTTEDAMEKMNLIVPTNLECFEKLLEAKNLKIKLSTFHLMRLSNDKKYLPLAEKYLQHKNSSVRNFAQLTVNTLRDVVVIL